MLRAQGQVGETISAGLGGRISTDEGARLPGCCASGKKELWCVDFVRPVFEKRRICAHRASSGAQRPDRFAQRVCFGPWSELTVSGLALNEMKP